MAVVVGASSYVAEKCGWESRCEAQMQGATGFIFRASAPHSKPAGGAASTAAIRVVARTHDGERSTVGVCRLSALTAVAASSIILFANCLLMCLRHTLRATQRRVSTCIVLRACAQKLGMQNYSEKPQTRGAPEKKAKSTSRPRDAMPWYVLVAPQPRVEILACNGPPACSPLPLHLVQRVYPRKAHQLPVP